MNMSPKGPHPRRSWGPFKSVASIVTAEVVKTAGGKTTSIIPVFLVKWFLKRGQVRTIKNKRYNTTKERTNEKNKKKSPAGGVKPKKTRRNVHFPAFSSSGRRQAAQPQQQQQSAVAEE